MKLLIAIIFFIIVNLIITAWLRYRNGNDGWVEYYRRKSLDKGK